MIDPLLQRTHAPVIPVITVHDRDDVAPLITTLAEAGLSTCEITLRSEIGIEAIQIAASLQLDIAIGAGTVISPHQVLAATEAGATFLVSPGLSQEVVQSAQQLEVPFIPGIATASELQTAVALGVDTVKVFPIEHIGGLGLLNAFASVWPTMNFVPTGGVTIESARHYLQHPAVVAVGGSWMLPSDALKAKDWSRVSHLAFQTSQLVGEQQ